MASQKNKKYFFIFLLILINLVVFSNLIYAPPSPHSVNGYIKLSNGSQVPLNTSYRVNVSNNGATIYYKQSKTSFPLPGYSGYYSESVSGTDGDNITIIAWNNQYYGITQKTLIGTMSGVNVTLNLSRDAEPTVNITSPTSNVLKNDSTFFTVYSNLTLYGNNANNCVAQISFSNTSVLSMYDGQTQIVNFGSLSLGYSIIYNWNLSVASVGSTNITVNFTCDNMFGTKFENLNYTQTITNISTTDVSPPNITLYYPTQNAVFSNSLVQFNYSVFDTSEISFCELYIDGSLMQTEILPQKNTNLTFSETISDGLHYWNITCNDTLNNQAISETRNFTIDTISPQIIILNPINNDQINNHTLIIDYKTIENGVGVKNCSILLNGSVIFNDLNVINNTIISHNYTLLMGSYYLEVACYDTAGNYNITDKTYFEIIFPDLTITINDIRFEYTSLTEGSNATIYANITNIGNMNATDFIVQFYKGDPDNGGVQIGVDQIVTFLDKTSSINLNETFTLNRGDNIIYVLVDTPLNTNGTVFESNESDNLANKNLLVSSWQVFYGYKNYNMMLGSDTKIVLGWAVNNGVNILFTEEGTSFSWTNLVALGRNTTNNISNNDFSEADTALNLSDVSDSIYNQYTITGIPLRLQNISIGGLNIQNIPMSNSTNNSNFVTGILWDKGDGGVEYDGSQDLIFITQTNYAQGKFGVYDYEVKIPASLKNYKLNAGRVTIYSELI